MERKIGEIFEYNGEWYQCVEGLYCDDCAFINDNCENRERITLREKFTKQPTTGFCNFEKRNDRKSVIFKKLKKVGENVIVKGRTFQKLISDNNSCKECVFNVPNKACCKNSYIEGICDDNGFWVEIKQNKEDMEGKKLNLKPFDLQKAKAGKPVCTRDGRKARIICWDIEYRDNPIAAAVFMGECETVYLYTDKGEYNKGEEDELDLMMISEKKEGWVVIHKEAIYDKETAEKIARETKANVIRIQKIEWEE